MLHLIISLRSREGANWAIRPNILSRIIFFCIVVFLSACNTSWPSLVKPLFDTDCLPHSGYVHTVPDRFLLHCKSCSGTVWTRINVLLRCRNCSEAFPVWTKAKPYPSYNLQRCLLIWKDYFPKRGSVAISALIKVFTLDSDRFRNLSDTERFTFNSGAEQYCSGAETASKAAF